MPFAGSRPTRYAIPLHARTREGVAAVWGGDGGALTQP